MRFQLDDPNTVDDPSTVDDETPTDDTPPSDDGDTSDEQDEEHCHGFGRHRIGRAVEHLFTILDTNEDGALTTDEIPESLMRVLEPIDSNGDGMITLQELITYRDSLPSRAFTRLDDNGDGLIMQDEVNEMLWTMLVDSDTDGDSAISPQEFPETRSFRHRGGQFGGFRAVRFGERFH